MGYNVGITLAGYYNEDEEYKTVLSVKRATVYDVDETYYIKDDN